MTHFAVSRSGVYGVAVGVAGGALAETEAVRSEVATWRNRFARLADQRALVPLWAGSFGAAHGERGTLAALCSVLARRPELRDRLADVERTQALVSAMAARPLAARTEESGLRRRTVEVLYALRSLGYRHAVEGRPLPGQPRPALDQIVDDVVRRLRANPYVLDSKIDRAKVAGLVRRHYVDVEPWPFEALLADRPRSQRRERRR